ncbi:Radical S-adenosyl methionine domain-containing protein 2, partial [Ascosphaera pollenicola]
MLKETLSSLSHYLSSFPSFTPQTLLLDILTSPLAIVIIFVTTNLTIALRQILKDRRTIPISVNYHFSRECNKDCGFCFYTAKSSYTLTEDDAKRGLRLLREAGTKKVNFAGGEPFLNEKFLGSMIVYCKQELKFESVSIVSNGSLIKKPFFQKYGKWLDILAISCDSFDEKTNIAIGRGSGQQVDQLYRIAGWCREFGVKFKINTV